MPSTKSILLALFLIAFTGMPMTWAAPQEAPANTVDSTHEGSDLFDTRPHVESFDEVWQTIRNTHWDPEVVGSAWDEAREKYRPRVKNASSVEEARAAIKDLLKTLKQSHFGIIPADEYESINEEKEKGGEGACGLEIRMANDQLLVTRVFPESPAAKAGVQPGWRVKLIGDQTAPEIIENARKVSKHTVMRLDTTVGLACDARASGDVGDTRAFAFVDHEDKVKLEYLELVDRPGQPETFGHLPTFNVEFESRVLPEQIGYIRFNAFIGGPRLAREYAEAIKEFQDSTYGLIIDLRGNRGGLLLLVAGMCGWLVEDRDPIGTMTMSGGNHMNIALNPRHPRYKQPVAVLIDECSISAAEIMAGGIKDLGIGRLFGKTTAGLSLPSTVVRLPNGDGFQYAMASYESANGESIEGSGVQPHETIELTPEKLAEEHDPFMSAAKNWIMKQVDQ